MKIIKKVLPYIVIGLTVYFFSKSLAANWANVQSISLAPSLYSIIALALFIFAIIISGTLWGKVLNRISVDNQISQRDAVRVHLASWLLKYVPGQAGSYLNKVFWGNAHGFSQKTISLSFLYENVLQFFASTIPVLPLLLLLPNIQIDYALFIPLLIAAPFVLVLNKSIFHKIVNFVSKKIRNKEIDADRFIDSRQLLKLQLWYVIPRVLNGAGFVLLAISLYSITPAMYLPLAGAYVLAGIIGILSIFVPSGIGVREAVIVGFATAYFPVEQAIVLAILARFYATVADLGVFGVYLYLNKWRIAQQ